MTSDTTHTGLTVQQHILLEQQRAPGATGEFSWLLSGITLASKLIQSKVRRGGLTDLLGAHETVNVQGEVQQKLDVYANAVMAECLGRRHSVALVASEEDEKPIIFEHASEGGKYIVVYDPIDGSSNIDVNVSVGTTFSIFRYSADSDNTPMEQLLRPGIEQVAAGYVIYGSSTMLVYTVGNGVHGFTLDPAVGAYILSHEDIRMPESGPYVSVNESYTDSFPKPYQDYLTHVRKGGLGKKYSSRYIGSMVADFHRTLLRGGIYLYPPTGSHANGKLRLLYEASPIAFIAEQAGGLATDGYRRILELQPEEIHQRTPVVVGSQHEMKAFETFMNQ